ncbi:hypothetical protein ABKN59_011318 [Abortiporus biennis]
MASRRAGASAKTMKASQQSASSDDNGMMLAVAQKVQLKWDKKKKEAEDKFFASANTEINAITSHKVEEFSAAVGQMDALYEQFLMDYVTCNDEIRKLLVAILAEQQKFLEVAQRQHKRIAESDQRRGQGHVRGLAMAKKSVEDANLLIHSLSRG